MKLVSDDMNDNVQIQKDGIKAFKEEKQSIKKQMEELNSLEGHDYEVLRAKQNIAEEFKNIKMKNRLVENDGFFNVQVNLTPYDFDYVIDGNRNVMLMVNTKACQKCTFMKIIYVSFYSLVLFRVMLLRRVLRVLYLHQLMVISILISLYGSWREVHVQANYSTDPNEPIVWFQKGVSTSVCLFYEFL